MSIDRHGGWCSLQPALALAAARDDRAAGVMAYRIGRCRDSSTFEDLDFSRRLHAVGPTVTVTPGHSSVR